MAKVGFTAGRVAAFRCPVGKQQAFLWDTDAPGLGLRHTPNGGSAFVFQGVFNGKSLRMVIGSPDAWEIPRARVKAREYQRLIDEGRDPRQVKAATMAADIERREEDRRQGVTVAEAWADYLDARRPHWGARNYQDHLKLAQKGGKERSNRKGVETTDGPLAALMQMALRDLDGSAVQAWAAKESTVRPARLRLALRLLKAFLRWCGEEPKYRPVAHANAASGKKTRETAGKPRKEKNALQREQLGPWFDAVRGNQNQVIAAYLQCLLLSGRRKEQVMALRWEDVDFRWRTIAMKDKTEGDVTVPLTPYMAHLMASLPRRNEWVFSSVKTISQDAKNLRRRDRYHAARGTEAPSGGLTVASASGRLMDPSDAHRQACAVAGIKGLTLHDLRRSFATLSEWVETPAGIAAQIQGHAPQGVREQNYVRRALDILRKWHEKIEAWMLEQAGIKFDPTTVPVCLQAVP